MKTKGFKTVVLVLIALMVLGLSISVGAQDIPEPKTLKVRFFNDEPIHMDEVVEEFYRRSKDDLNVELDIAWNPPEDHKQLLLLASASGEELDLVFDAQWMHIERLSRDGFYTDLEKYFNNDEYPGLKARFSEEYLDNNRFHGGIYAIPLTQELDSIEGITIRKDLMDKYGFEEIKTMDELQEFYEVILANEPDITPLGTWGTFFRLFPRYTEEQNIFQITDVYVGNMYVALSDDNTKVLGVYIDGDPEEYIENFPAPWNTTEKWNEKFVKYREWSKYIEEDPLGADTVTSPADFASYNRGLGNLADLDELKLHVPEANNYDVPVYTFPYRKGDRLRIPNSKYINYQAWNYVAVPVTSKDPDRVMKFVDWIFQSRDNHDLFEYGIEGEHWIAVGDDTYRYPEELDQPYVFPWYQLTGTTDWIRRYEDFPQEWIEIYEWSNDEERNMLSPLAGFTFNHEPLRIIKASTDQIFSSVEGGLMAGQYEDPAAVLAQANSQARNAGLDVIREELAKQVQEYLDQNNN